MKKYKYFMWDYGNGIMGKCLWFRLCGYGLHFKKYNGMILFSERYGDTDIRLYGYTAYKIFFRVKIKVLKP